MEMWRWGFTEGHQADSPRRQVWWQLKGIITVETERWTDVCRGWESVENQMKVLRVLIKQATIRLNKLAWKNKSCLMTALVQNNKYLVEKLWANER